MRRCDGRWRSFGESVFFIPDSWYNNMYEKVFYGKNKKGKRKMSNYEHSTILKSTCLTLVGLVLTLMGIWIYGRYVTRQDVPTLHVYNWSDYIAPEVIRDFEKRFDCKVCIDTFDDNESMLAKMQAGATGYDIIFPSSYMIPVLKRNGIIKALDMSRLPNVKNNFDDKFKDAIHEDTFVYSVPYAFSITGIAYRNDKIELDDQQKKGIFSWDFMMQNSLMSKTSVMNDIREVLGIGLKMNGYSNNSTNKEEISKACATAVKLKKCARRLDSVEYRVGLVSGAFYAAMAYSCDIFQIMQENPDVPISFVVPMEGSNMSWDEMCITATSEKTDLAHKFIDFLYDPEIAVQNIDYAGSAVPNKSMILPDEIKNSPLIDIPEEVLNRVELIKDVGDSISIYNKEWDNFLSSH